MNPDSPLAAPGGVNTDAMEVVDFWRAAGATAWFDKAPDFDRSFRERFIALHVAAAGRECDHWAARAEGALALLILLDQFPRNAFRGTARMYATDPLARHFAHAAVEAGMDGQVEPALRLFFYLPFAHSEDLADQHRSVQLNRKLGQPELDHATGHLRVIERFGRFPHRNPIFGRETTAQEQVFLDQGGFAG